MSFIKISFVKRKLLISRAKFWSLASFLVLLLLLDLWWLIFSVAKHKILPSTIAQFVVFLTLTAVMVWIVNWVTNILTKKFDPIIDRWKFDIDISKKGDRGEEVVFSELSKFLFPDQYTIFRNLVLPGRNSDIDFIIVGSKGVIVLEIKNYSTKTVFTKDQANYRDKSGLLHFLTRDSRESVQWQAEGLEQFLFLNGIDVTPLKALVFVDSDSVELKDYKNNYGVYVVRGISQLRKYIDNLFENISFTIQHCASICSILEKIKEPEKFDSPFKTVSSINFLPK